jgi:hypothetical protein
MVLKGGTNHVERLNGTVRHFSSSHKRSAYTFPKKLANYEVYIALQIVHYDFCWVPRTLRVTPAMEVGLTEKIWEARDLVMLAEELIVYRRPRSRA